MANTKTHFAVHMQATFDQGQLALKLFEELKAAHAEGRAPGKEAEDFEEFEFVIQDLPELGFKIEANSVGDGEHVGLLITPGDGVGNEQIAALFVQELLRQFEEPDRVVGMQWSTTCSSPREDGFIGGYFVITEDEINGADTTALMEAEIKKMEASKTAAPALG